MFTTRPYLARFLGLQRIGYIDTRRIITPGKTPEYEPLFYCGFCNQYAIYHEHECIDDRPWDPYDGYPSDAPDTD